MGANIDIIMMCYDRQFVQVSYEIVNNSLSKVFMMFLLPNERLNGCMILIVTTNITLPTDTTTE